MSLSRRQFVLSSAAAISTSSVINAQDGGHLLATVTVVDVFATVRKKSREIVRDLTKDDFSISENGTVPTVIHHHRLSCVKVAQSAPADQ